MIDLGLEIYRVVGREADRMGVDAYAVGGVVRDYFLQRPSRCPSTMVPSLRSCMVV